MSNLPDFFQNEEQYEEILADHVEEQTDEFLEYMEPDEITKETIDEWCRDAPFIDLDTMELARLYDDVKRHSSRATIYEAGDVFTKTEWFKDPYGCMATLVTEWIAMDVADRMQLEIESRGVSTHP